MRRKKAAATPSRYVTERDGFSYLTREALLEFELSEARVLNALQAIGMKRAEITMANAAHIEAQRVAQRDLAALVESSKQQEDALRRMRADFQTATGIDITQMTYDDQTGKLGTVEPARR